MTATTHQPLPIPPGYHACRACGSPYVQETEGQDSCRLCAGSGRKQATFPPRDCDLCGGEYVPFSSASRYCVDCAPIAKARRDARRNQKRKEEWRSKQQQCYICDNMYWPKTSRSVTCYNPACLRERERQLDEIRRDFG